MQDLSTAWKNQKSVAKEIFLEEARRGELEIVLGEFTQHRLDALIFKGAALSYLLYPRSGLRPRCDTDILIREQDIDRVHEVMLRLGYERENQNQGRHISYQAAYSRSDSLGVRHIFDVHWRVCNPKLFANLISFAEAEASAVDIPALEHVHGRGFGPPHSLLMACVHRVAHHFDDENSVWLQDIHLLVEQLDATTLNDFIELAQRKGMRAICSRGILLAREKFGTDLPLALAEFCRSEKSTEASSAYLRKRRHWLWHLWQDLQEMPHWRARLEVLREHALPAPEYMRQKFSRRTKTPLVLLYMWRIFFGLRKIFRQARP